MFQNFEANSSPEFGALRLALLRDKMSERGLDGFIIPRSDAHQGEGVAPHDERLAWATGFTGSAGFAIILAKAAAVFTDGRYRLQLSQQCDMSLFTPKDWPADKPADWLREQLKGGVIGFDPWLHTQNEIAAIRAGLEGSAIELEPVDNLIDAVWTSQPEPPSGRLFPFPEEYAGESSAEKRTRLGAELARAGQSAAVLTLPDSIMWLLNTRGEDVPRTPVAHGFAVLHADARVDYFTRARPVDELELASGVRLHPYEDFAPMLRVLIGSVRVDRATAPVAVADLLEEGDAEVVWGPDPCILPKAKKNAAEIAATTAAHHRDAVAMVEFLAWLDRELPKGELTEIGVVTALEGFRRASNALQDISFDTILGSGPNGAVIHYRVTRASDRLIGPGEMIVVDSGAQYLDGTTDITRTVARGTVGLAERQACTRVLQGMIAISRLRFPKGLTGGHIDALARAPLWMAGQDYDHGTGHGVGVYLGVHEGPARISRTSDVPLEPGMILSNEPGYYRDGAFGIRIENLIVTEAAGPIVGGDDHRKMLAFRTLTYVPIDRRLIEVEMLSASERDWLNRYHADCRKVVAGKLSAEAEAWLTKMTEPI